MKNCGKCGKEKPLSEFSKKSTGAGGINSTCKSCVRAYWNKWYADPKNRVSHINASAANTELRRAHFREMINDLKNHPCMDCGHSYPSWVMHFDHVPGRGKKKYNVSRFARGDGSEKALRVEIAKCHLVCANCHAERTHQRAVGANQV